MMEGIKKWLAEHPVGRLVLARLVVAALGALAGVLATLGLLDAQLAAQLQGALGL